MKLRTKILIGVIILIVVMSFISTLRTHYDDIYFLSWLWRKS